MTFGGWGRSIGALALALRLAPGGVVLLAAAEPAFDPSSGVYTLIRDGRRHEVPTVARDGEDFLALPELARALGASLAPASGDGERIQVGSSSVELRPGAGEAMVNGRPYSLSRPAFALAGKLWVPTDFVTKVLAAAMARAVRWRDEAAGLIARAGTTEIRGETEAVRAEVEIRSQRDYTRVLVRVPSHGLLPYTINAPQGRIVLRVQADGLVAAEPEILVADGAVERVAFEVTAGRGIFAIELGPDFRDYQHAVLRDPFRVVIDVYRRSPYTGPPVRVSSRMRETPPPPPPPPAATPAPVPGAAPPVDDLAAAPAPGRGEGEVGRAPAGRPGGEIRTVVIDPGHGGSEPGARGRDGLLEKEITLDLARRLARALESGLGLRVLLTRSADIDLSLDDRTGIANHEKADLFLSIHANASLRSNAHGAETYFLARSATDDESRKLAALENQALGEARGLEGTDLELILWSLAQNQYLEESQELAETIQTRLNESLGIADRGVKQAPFKVLVGATMPAVLVEVGFLTNPEEERRLNSEEYKDRIVTALFESVRQFKGSRAVRTGELAREPGARRGAAR